MSEVTRPARRKYRLRVVDHVIIAGLVVGLAALLLWPMTFVTVGSGHVGVLFRLFGGGTETRWVFPEGVATKWPWDGIELYETRVQSRDFSAKVLGVDGLLITVDCTVLFNPIPAEVGLLHEQVGPDYVNRVVLPSAIEAVRKVVGQYDPHAMYAASTYQLAADINEEMKASTVGLHIEFRDLLIRQVILPPKVDQAINEKITQQQIAQSYEYRIQQAMQEAERKRIEAIGIQTFYAIVANSLSPQLLTWRGIEATVEIAKSPNSKVVIVGGGENQLPLILGSDIAQQPEIPAPQPVDPSSNPLPNFNFLPRLFPELLLEQPRSVNDGHKNTGSE